MRLSTPLRKALDWQVRSIEVYTCMLPRAPHGFSAYTGRLQQGTVFVRLRAKCGPRRLEGVGCTQAFFPVAGTSGSTTVNTNICALVNAMGLPGRTFANSANTDTHTNQGADVAIQHCLNQLHSVAGNQFQPFPSQASSAVDMALWDLRAKLAGVPLWKLLRHEMATQDAGAGSGTKEVGDAAPSYFAPADPPSLEVYASLPFLQEQEAEAWPAAIKKCVPDGLPIRTVKIRGFGDERDQALVRAVHQQSLTPTAADGHHRRWMLNVEGQKSGTKGENEVLGLLDEMACAHPATYAWLESPFPDGQTSSYAKVRAQHPVLQLLPGGHTIMDAEVLRSMLAGCPEPPWTCGRFDVGICGGISGALRLRAAYRASGIKKLELQKWGHGCSQAANLHFMAADGTGSFFELPVDQRADGSACLETAPLDGPPVLDGDAEAVGAITALSGDFVVGMRQGGICFKSRDGFIAALPTTRNGLGVQMDWDQIRELSCNHTTLKA